MPIVLNLAMLVQAIASLAAFRDGDHGIGFVWLAVLAVEAGTRWA